MNSNPLHLRTRRHFFKDCGLGLGKVALASLLAGDLAGKALNKSSFALPAKAKHRRMFCGDIGNVPMRPVANLGDGFFGCANQFDDLRIF